MHLAAAAYRSGECSSGLTYVWVATWNYTPAFGWGLVLTGSAPLCSYWRWQEPSDRKAACAAHRKGLLQHRSCQPLGICTGTIVVPSGWISVSGCIHVGQKLREEDYNGIRSDQATHSIINVQDVFLRLSSLARPMSSLCTRPSHIAEHIPCQH